MAGPCPLSPPLLLTTRQGGNPSAGPADCRYARGRLPPCLFADGLPDAVAISAGDRAMGRRPHVGDDHQLPVFPAEETAARPERPERRDGPRIAAVDPPPIPGGCCCARAPGLAGPCVWRPPRRRRRDSHTAAPTMTYERPRPSPRTTTAPSPHPWRQRPIANAPVGPERMRAVSLPAAADCFCFLGRTQIRPDLGYPAAERRSGRAGFRRDVR